jgi:hypothetical protein
MKNKNLIALTLLFFLSGCSGFMWQSNRESTTTEPISDTTYKVTFAGSGYLSKAKAEKGAMQRASDLTLKKGFTHFAVIEKKDMTAPNQIEDIPRNTYDQKLSQSSTEKIACPQNLVRPKFTLIIQMFSAKDAPKDAIDAKQYLNDNPKE